MPDALEALVESLLYEGYALYPYTPGATKNSTPTPFGIVYPPVYAEAMTTTYDHLELRCVLMAPADAVLSGEVRFLAPLGERHQAQAHALQLPGVMIGAIVHGEPVVKRASASGPGGPPLEVALSLSAIELAPGEYEVAFRIENRHRRLLRPRPRRGARALADLDPPAATDHRRTVHLGARAIVPIGQHLPGAGLAEDDVMLGAAIVLPDHPSIAPESLGGLFDSTEIEEALLLHVHVLSDGERAEIEEQDPAVKEMIARAAAATPQDIINLHGRVTIRDPVTTEPPTEPPGLSDPRAGDELAEVGGQRFVRGGKVIIRPAEDADLHARMLDGRTATIERIFTDYDGKTHLGVTIDDDPGQDLMRETGRYLYFFAQEVEVEPTSSALRDRPRAISRGAMMYKEPLRSVLIAGVGNAWLRDDGFGGEVARRLSERKLPDGCSVMDAGTGGLDLAYEVMRGYDGLVLLDVSKQGGEPGTLYVMEPDEESVPGAIDDGDVINPHGMDPQTMLRFVKSVGAWPGKVVVIACEPADVEEMGWGLTDRVKAAVDRAVDLVFETVAEMQAGVATPAE